MTISRLDVEMSSSEYSDWIVFAETEPFGDVRANIHSGTIAAIIANVNKQKGSRSYTYKDFMVMTTDERRDKESREFVSFLKSSAVKNG